MNLPQKLKKDSIVEAVCEIRFETTEFSEMVVGKLASLPLLKKYKGNRTALADIPSPIRANDEQLKYQPIIQFLCPENKIGINIGSNAVAFNNIREYKGWKTYFPELQEFLKNSLDSLNDFKITRAGLRYINALNPVDHLIADFSKLKIDLKVADQSLADNINVNYSKTLADNHIVTVRMSTPEFVTGLPEGAIALVDIDVYTKDCSNIKSHDELFKWLDQAHTLEKKEFFSLIPDDILMKIKEI